MGGWVGEWTAVALGPGGTLTSGGARGEAEGGGWSSGPVRADAPL